MTFEREFFHFDEPEQNGSINKYDIIELISTRAIQAYAWIPNHKLFAVTKFPEYPAHSTLGSFYYEGVVSISPDTALKMLTNNETASMTYVSISEPHKIQGWSAKAPNIKYPNDRYTNHIPCERAPAFKFIACMEPTSVSDKTAPFYEKIAEYSKKFITDKDLLARNNKIMDNNLERFSTYIESLSIKVKPSQFRFKKSELPTKQNTPPLTKNLTTQTAPNPLDEIILEILGTGNIRSDQVWNILRQEAKKEIFDRFYDTYGILLEVSNERLIWKGTTKEREITRRTFINKVSELRKAITQ